MSLDLHSVPFDAAGGTHASAARRAIGRPALDPWALFLRETLQNSWDARTDLAGPIDFAVDYRWMTPQQLQFLRSEVFPVAPPAGLGLEEMLAEPDLALLIVSDSGTRGLGGPTRADVHVEGRTDFVDFVRNVGRSADKEIGGGTYGFGKGVLFEASAAATVIVFTRTKDQDGQTVSRLIAIGIGESYDLDGLQYTGRHFWGRSDREVGVEPLVGAEAEAVAARLGMTRLGRDGTGTALAVVAPVAHEEAETSDEEIIRRIAEAALQWAWPHIVDETICFQFSHEGNPVELRDPRRDPVLGRYVDAYFAATGQQEDMASDTRFRVMDVKSQRPVKTLGRLGTRFFTAPRDVVSVIPMDGVALMRRPRLIVKYLSVSPDPSGRGQVSVFVADDGVDADFASSEPVAHDDWAPESMRLPKGHFNPVRVALDRIKEEFRNRARVHVPDDHVGTSRVVTQLATRLGSLLTPAPGGAPGLRPPRASKASGVRSPSAPGAARVEGRPRIWLEDGRLVAEYRVVLEGVWTPGDRLLAEPRVVLATGGTESSAPVGADQPAVRQWRTTEGGVVAEEGEVALVDWPTELLVVVEQPRETVVLVALRRLP
ncbi:hypothetical protein ACFQ46_07065 [Kineococcus sp. GCM10028916]|uniref:hypothetical protein n=1 Tax=Kineococcus sp. GCM10028916 TaxID=3273394 RepID=UPI00363FC1AB